ncbi:triacylglycerol lipase 1 [Impatiens glandulifera]|uniref:triacylglycerol lipase 1 n=1 Tax=Impatiens glandulifera TaxID=253017 RepID=UPI001FB0CACF|nr:triacylglycerol lipase 1 [Impatiens glandulifera]
MEPLFILFTAALLLIILPFFPISCVSAAAAVDLNIRRDPPTETFCSAVIEPNNYPCSEHTVKTEDGFVLGLQRVSSPNIIEQRAPPVLLLHGLLMGGDAWFLNSVNQSLGYILADHGFDVWVGNVRGTRWSHGHVSLSVRRKKFWDWSWEQLAEYDLTAMLNYVQSVARSKVFVVGHSQGTIMSLAAFTNPDVVNMVEGAALLCPISYLGHVFSPFVLRLVSIHLDQVILDMGIHELNFKSNIGAQILDYICDGHTDCNDLLSAITGANCCLNISRIDSYLQFEPHPSSTKNLKHLFQMIRKGTFSKFDYGRLKNMILYGSSEPPAFDVSLIPSSLPLWMAYGAEDALADITDFQHTLRDLRSKPELLYIEKYGHVDFLLSKTAYKDVYPHLIRFLFSTWGNKVSSM